MKRSGLATLLFFLLVGLAGGPLPAAPQDRSNPNQPTPPPESPPGPPATVEPLPPGFDPVALGLESEPRTFDALGLTIHLPRASTVQIERHQGQPSIVIHDKPQSPTWSLRINELRSSLSSPTATGQIADYLAELDQAGATYKVIHNRPVVYRGAPGQLCYLEQTSPEGRPFVSGWLVMPTDPGRFLVLSIYTLPDHRERVEKLLESSFSSLALKSLRRIDAERQSLLAGGAAYLSSLREPRLRPLIGTREWVRIYHEGQGQPAEIGYSVLEVAEGVRGELNPGREAGDYDPAEREMGLLVKMRSRVVVDAAAEHYLDWIGLYWTAWDQSSEAWSVRATQRRGNSEASESETGVLPAHGAGDPRPPLTVVRSSARTKNREPYEWAVPEVYLGQGLSWLVGRLKPLALMNGSAEVAFYCYDNTGEPAVSFRVDRWDEEPGGGWEHARRATGSEATTVTSYDRAGRFLRSRRSDGSIVEPTTPQALERLWRSKKLRMGSEG